MRTDVGEERNGKVAGRLVVGLVDRIESLVPIVVLVVRG